MIITLENTWAKVTYQDEPTSQRDKINNYLDQKMAVPIPGAEFAPSVRTGHWDGMKHFYDLKTQQFPTGNIKKAQDLLDKVKYSLDFDYQVVDDRPDPFVDYKDIPDTIKINKQGEVLTLRDYQVEGVKAVFKTRAGGILHQSVGSGKTASAAAIIKILVPKLEKGERVLFFTNNKEIFNQDIDNLADALQMKIGYLGGGKKKMAKVMVCMIPTVASYLKIDPEAGLTLTPKEHQVKKMATLYADKFLTATNPYQQLKTFINLFTPIKKVDQVTYKLLEEVRDTCGSNQDVVNTFHNYQEQYRQLINTKASAKVKKADFIHDLLDSCVAFIGDEVQHTKADTWYTTMLACENAIYKVGLTGSIDPNDELMVTRLQSVFGEVVARVRSKELIDKGILAKPKILMIPIREPDTIANNKKWQEVYKFGIVENEYRNKVIAALAARWYGEGKTVLIIVKELAHMDYLSSMLDSVQIPHELINGTQQDEDRKQELVNIKDGSNRVLIATSVLDEGVDIANIDTLILAAGGKSLRQVIQRVGRVLRKKVGKENKALIVDFDDRENLYLRNHSRNRMQIYKQEQFEVTQVEG